MAKNEARARALSGPSGVAGKAAADGEKKREKRTITEIRESKRTGEKMVYMSVPDYTSAKWAEMAGVDVAVVGDSLAMVAHGHPNTIPASMDMMIMHARRPFGAEPRILSFWDACLTRATTRSTARW